MARTPHSNRVFDRGVPATKHCFSQKPQNPGSSVTSAQVTECTSKPWLIGGLPHMEAAIIII